MALKEAREGLWISCGMRKTHFQSGCEKLEVEIIPAESLRAEGRVERNRGA
ncbi:MAG: hypothetical protein LBL45_13290 [Treponema sp.]|jgi:hypothetical protein|nr:hypothetical protein [Treponema sp.]